MTPDKAGWRRRWIWRILFVIAVLAAAGVLAVYIRRPSRDEVLFRKGFINHRAGRRVQAVENFRKCLELKPDRMDARTVLIEELKELRSFAEALAELDIAVQKGMGAQDATIQRAGIFLARARAQVQTAGNAADVGLCDRILTEDIRPATALVQGLTKSPGADQSVYQVLGDLYSQEAIILLSKRRMLARARDNARKLRKTEEAAARDADAMNVVPEINIAESLAVEAYTRAMEKDPNVLAPRLALAQYALALYVPDADRARALLAPILKDNPNHRPTLLLLVRTERAAGRPDKALEIVRHMRAGEPEDPGLMLLELSLLIKAEKWTEAAPLSEKVAEKFLPRDLETADLAQGYDADYSRGLVLLHAGRATEAAVCLQDIFGPDATVRWPQARLALAQALERMGNREQAVSNYRAVLPDAEEISISNIQTEAEVRETQYQACLALIRILKTDDVDTVSECAATALRIHPANDEAFDAARDACRAARQTKKDFADLVLVRATALAAAGKPDSALAECRKELETGANSVAATGRLRNMVARLLAAQGAFEEAAAIYEKLWQEFPVGMGYGEELATLKIRLGRNEEARKIYEKLIDSDPSDARASQELLVLLVTTGDLAGARALVGRAEARFGPDSTASVLTGLAVLEGRLDDAISIARQWTQQRPDYAPAQVSLAELLWQRGDLAGARAALDAAVKADPNYVPAYRRGLLDLQEGRAADAVSLYRDAARRFPTDIGIRALLTVALQADGRTDEAIDLMERLLINVKKYAVVADPAHWTLAVMEAGRGNLEKAASHNSLISGSEMGLRGEREGLLNRLAALGASDRDEAARNLNLLAAFVDAGCRPGALTRVETLQKLLPGQAMPECWYARMLSRIGWQAEALQRYERLRSEHPDSDYICELTAECYERDSNMAAAVHMLEQALRHASAEHRSWLQFRLGNLYERQGDLERAISNYRNVISAGTWAPQACNNLAYLLATKKNDLVSALPLAQQAARLANDMPAFQDTLGWIYFLRGDTEKAIACLELARAGLPAVPTIRYHLGMAYLKSNRRDDARLALKEAIGLSRNFPEAADAQRVLNGL